MILLLIGIAFVINGFLRESVAGFFVSFAIGAVLIAVGITCPIHGYHESALQDEYELLPISPISDVYIIEDSDGSVTCRRIKEKEHDEEMAKDMLYTYENAEIVVIEDGSVPVLREYLKEPKTSPLAIVKGGTKTEYIFFVPESAIERWQNEHVN